MQHRFLMSVDHGCGTPDTYATSSFHVAPRETSITDAQKGGAMKTFLEWMLVDGQALASSLLYPPLPRQVIDLERKAIEQIAVGPH